MGTVVRLLAEWYVPQLFVNRFNTFDLFDCFVSFDVPKKVEKIFHLLEYKKSYFSSTREPQRRGQEPHWALEPQVTDPWSSVTHSNPNLYSYRTCGNNNSWYRLFAGNGSRCVGILWHLQMKMQRTERLRTAQYSTPEIETTGTILRS